jgi:ABC-type dipeptide/oligopeptide/nickel transport system ATPase component
MTASSDIVLSVRDLRVTFTTLGGEIEAVRGVSFDLRRGKTLALVGESGSGKSVTSYSILRLIQKPGVIRAGQMLFHAQDGSQADIARLDERSDALYRIRGGKIAMVFQEPMTALSPVHTVGNQIVEAILLHQPVTRLRARQIARDMLVRVGINNPDQRLDQYPFEFSGGMRQRVVIAMALVCKPEILIADEPTTALDVTVQAQILKLMADLQRDMGTSVLFITHDLGVVAQIADEVAVMQKGLIVERAAVREIYRNPVHPYTRQLLEAIPHMGQSRSFDHQPHPPLPEGWDFSEIPRGESRLHTLAGHDVLLWRRRGAA